MVSQLFSPTRNIRIIWLVTQQSFCSLNSQYYLDFCNTMTHHVMHPCLLGLHNLNESTNILLMLKNRSRKIEHIYTIRCFGITLHFLLFYIIETICVLVWLALVVKNAVCVLFLPPTAGGTGTNMPQDGYPFIYVRIKYIMSNIFFFTFME